MLCTETEEQDVQLLVKIVSWTNQCSRLSFCVSFVTQNVTKCRHSYIRCI